MDKRFCGLKAYVIDNQLALKGQLDEGNISFDYIGDTKIYHYGNKQELQAGMWMQDDSGNLRIYNRTSEEESIYWDHYEEDKKAGVIHSHNEIEIGYVADGSAQQEFYGVMHTFKEGDFWIVDRNCYHRDMYQKANLLTVYVGVPSDLFDASLLESVGNSKIAQFLSHALIEQKKNRQYIHFKPKGMNVKGGDIMEKLLQELVNQRAGYNDIARSYIIRLLETLATDYDFLISTKEKQKARDLLFYDVEKYIHSHYKDATISKLVEIFHYNNDFYNRLFKEYTGKTYIKYLANLRLIKAKEMLVSTENSIESIASEVGYNNRGHFYRLFSKEYGMTPAKFRIHDTLGKGGY